MFPSISVAELSAILPDYILPQGTGEMRTRGEEDTGKIKNSLFTNYQLRITHYQLPITNYQLPITNYQLPITNYELRITNYQLPITNYQLYDSY
ncbi:hypothetical protein [Anabaena lutea]|uniref:Uncharacterized protein n=1 Tax=Anabaena lutea FACHB-196 TaxID=2692881 RepID=A0ABR8FE93_9NOST|nr:hypothetical protein [Anabaena lutea]MBD2568294.1 hypothetical protein [Anabaena lutea FACHB-196]